ncbi:unnamed protein product, partial [Cuscuta epithymum]
MILTASVSPISWSSGQQRKIPNFFGFPEPIYSCFHFFSTDFPEIPFLDSHRSDMRESKLSMKAPMLVQN